MSQARPGFAVAGVTALALVYGTCASVFCGSPREKAPAASLHSSSSDVATKPEVAASTPKPAPPPAPAPPPEPHPKKHGKHKPAKHHEAKAAAHSPTSDELFQEAEKKAAARPTAPARSCCKYCSSGQPCGDSCISASKTCRKGPGCAC